MGKFIYFVLGSFLCGSGFWMLFVAKGDGFFNGLALIIILLGLLLFCFLLKEIQDEKDAKEKLEIDAKNYEIKLKEYKEKLNEIIIPKNARKIRISFDEFLFDKEIRKWYYFSWCDESNMYLFPTEPIIPGISRYPELSIITIPKGSIISYSVEGDFYRETKISGGGGGGSSIGGAIVGGLIAGETGAIIGSRNKIDKINSEIIEHDTRHIKFKVYDNEEIKSIWLNFINYESLKDIIPEKDIEIIESVKKDQIIKSFNSESKYNKEIEKARLLKQMLDEGIISSEIYEDKIRDLI